MNKSSFSLIAILIFFMVAYLQHSVVKAQQRAVLDNYGNITYVKGTLNEALSTAKMKLPSRAHSSDLNFAAKGTIDTLGYEEYYVSPGINFGMAANDYLYQYFEAPTEMSLLGVGFLPLEWNGNFGNENATAEVKLVNSNWSKDEFSQFSNTNTTESFRIGYYPASGNLPNPITPYIDDSGVSGNWVDVGGFGEPFGNDLWSDFGAGATVPLTRDVWSWVDLTVLFTPEVSRGDVFGISVKNASGYDPYTYQSSNFGCFSDEEAPVVGMKFYAGERLDEGDYGWWTRSPYSWDFLLIVDITGDMPPEIQNETVLGTTLSTSSREVTATITDTNPSGGNAGVANAYIKYSVDNGSNWFTVDMSYYGSNYFGNIPGQSPGTYVKYFVTATDVEGNTSESQQHEYSIFNPQSNTLLVFNGFTEPAGYPQSYYFGKDDFASYEPYEFDHDVWSYGALTAELLNYYTNLIEISSSGPNYINSDVVRVWLESNGSRNYMLAGDEWLGSQTGWSNQDYTPGDFQYDILGIDADFNDLVSSSADVSDLFAVNGSLLGTALYQKKQTVSGADTLKYDPNYEIAVTNWLDGADFLGDVDVFMQTVYEGITYDVGGSRVLPNGNKVAFFAYDPLSVNSSPEYYWFGFSESAPQVEVLKWFGDEEPNRLNVTIPDTSFNYDEANTLIEVPIYVDDLTDQNIISFQFSINFDTTVIKNTTQSIITDETISDASTWTVLPNPNLPGVLTVGGFGSASLVGGGELIKLVFEMQKTHAQTNLDFNEFVFNSGDPAVNANSGSVFVQYEKDIWLPDTTVNYNSSNPAINIPVYVEDLTNEGIISYQFTVQFDPSLLNATDISLENTISDISDWTVLPNTTNPGEIRVGAFGATPIEGSGKLVDLIFEPTGDEGETELTFSEFIFNSGMPNANTTNGYLNIMLGMCGDANEDGTVYAQDAAFTLQHAIELITLTEQGQVNADVNMDASVGAWDAALILRHVIELEQPVATCFDSGTKKAADSGVLSDISIYPESIKKQDDHTTLILGVSNNSENEVYSIQFNAKSESRFSMKFSELNDDYLTAVNNSEEMEKKIGIANPYGVNTDDVKIEVIISGDEDLNSLDFSQILVNGYEVSNIQISNPIQNLTINDYKLVGSYPNPFNPSTKIVFQVPEQSKVILKIYDILGKEIATLVDSELDRGHYEVLWNGENNNGHKVATGNYIATMSSGDYFSAIKLNLIK
ncbi:MAG: hypothetical protein K9J16_13480 [Melioribacteraceae bacterium]|nr:hypothetical protein [Melioribacteraceae bacterium]MCF8355431.1 hypothetical protein [Melioribacteraceae bacterium]MCF8395366.1 hypothetical protein [Melioribacteraceae bacterium]MCF8420459.1 hypothetical protein [Melioribacteraceae bacterium]